MSKYTTGEIAKLCGVSVRTVQYYDSRNILVPSSLTEGGRRLYSEDDLKRMRIICFLRDIGLPINGIGELLGEDDPGSVISILLEQQEKSLQSEADELHSKLDKIRTLKSELKTLGEFTVESIGDAAHIMKNKDKLRKMRTLFIVTAVVMEAIEISTAVIWWQTGIWWPFALGMCVMLAYAMWLSVYYYRSVTYICPQCHEVFKPAFREMFFAYHTPKTRRLNCPKCAHKGMCVETYDEGENKI